MRRILGLCAAIAILPSLGAGCGGEEEAIEEVELEVGEEPEPTETAEETADEPEEPPEAEEPVEEPTVLDDRALEELAELQETLGNARTAAETYESGSTICEAAHASLAAMMAAVAERYPDQVADVPPKGAFVQACEQLPEEAQECLLPRHVMSHQEDCRAIADRLDPDQRAYLERVLAGG
jgi:hypothetical protein